ncbi:MAG: hypothetical protein ACOY82_11360 [Pseudomonadota bacterium]
MRRRFRDRRIRFDAGTLSLLVRSARTLPSMKKSTTRSKIAGPTGDERIMRATQKVSIETIRARRLARPLRIDDSARPAA